MAAAQTILVEPDDAGIRLDRWFRRHFAGLSHGQLEKLLRTGQVRLDGKRAKSGDRVEAGQSVRLPPQLQSLVAAGAAPPGEKSQSIRKSRTDERLLEDAVLHRDEQVLVLNKPPGLASQGGSGQTRHVDGLLETLTFGKRQRPKLVHRLDRDTSGVLVVARSTSAAAALGQSLRHRDASKIYWALTRGVPKQARGRIKLALAKESAPGPGGRVERVVAAEDEETGKFAITDYVVLGRAGDEFAWIAARPVTGRTHQIRVHLASLGTPIVGDFKYGGAGARGRGAIADKLHLHARSIDIAHPAGGRLRVTAPLPAHMLASWKLLGFDPNYKDDPFEGRGRK